MFGTNSHQGYYAFVFFLLFICTLHGTNQNNQQTKVTHYGLILSIFHNCVGVCCVRLWMQFAAHRADACHGDDETQRAAQTRK